jgi:prevent-host-death family protein
MDGCIQVLDVDDGTADNVDQRWSGPTMETINLYDAKTYLSQLVERAAAGEEIIIAKAGRPLARLVPLAQRTGPRPLGLFAGQVELGSDFDDPLPDEMRRAFEGYAP